MQTNPLKSTDEDIKKAGMVVKENIPGKRKGMDKPAYKHSFDVYRRLVEAGESKEVCLGGLLHDVWEDGGVSFDELREMGFSDRVVVLVDLCSHDVEMDHNDSRWVKMMARIIEYQDRDAFLIKVADVLSNLHDAVNMDKDRQAFMFDVKRGLLLSIAEPTIGNHPIWKELEVFRFEE
jgi:(p)ppGpp synthase/HD superfamily hydrolase